MLQATAPREFESVGTLVGMIEKPPMKNKLQYLLVAVIATALVVPGCVSSDDPDRQVKIEQTKAAVSAVASAAIRRVIVKNPETRPIFEAAGRVFGSIAETGKFDPASVSNELTAAIVSSGLLGGLSDEGRQTVLDVKTLLVTLYAIHYVDRFRADVSEREFLIQLADGFSKAISSALTDFSL